MYIVRNLLITGGKGDFAKEVKTQFSSKYKIYNPSKQEMDVSNYDSIENFCIDKSIDLVIHAGAMTKPTDKHEEYPDESILNNIIGTSNITIFCIKRDIKLVYISSESVYGNGINCSEIDAINPIDNYSLSKAGGEFAVKEYKNSLIIRGAFCKIPFDSEWAYTNIIKNYISHKDAVFFLLNNIDEKGIINVGGQEMTYYDFVKQYNSNIIPKQHIKGLKRTLNLSKMNNLIK